MRKLAFLALGAVPLSLLACASPRSEDLGRVSSGLDDREGDRDRTREEERGDREPTRSDRDPPRDCPPPAPDICSRVEYLRSECGPTCEGVLHIKLSEYVKKAPRWRKMWPNDVPKDSFNLVTRAFYPHEPKSLLPATGGGLAQDEQDVANLFRMSAFAETPQAIAQAVSQAAAYHQQPSWDANGVQVGSCKEYVYESFYDYSRYRDAIAACNGNQSCIFEIAYHPGNPGIANRKLRRKDELPIWKQPEKQAGDIVAYGQDAPKNAFYRMGGSVMTGIADLFPNHPHVAALAAELDSGRHYWNSGLPGDDRIKHATDFDYLAFVQKKTIGTGIEEFEEYERRNAEIDTLFAKYQDRLSAAGACAGHKSFDPLNPSPPSNQLSPAGFVNSGFTAELSGLVLSPQVLSASCGTGYAIPLVETLTSQMAITYGNEEPGLFCPEDTANDTPQIAARNAGCRVVNALLVEWNRRQRGGGGCLESGFYGCDFSPTRFVERYATQDLYVTEREKLYQDCMERTAGAPIPLQPDLITMSGYIHQAASALDEEKERAKMIEPGRYGQILSEGEQWGEPGIFTAGFQSYVGWGLEALEVTSGYSDPDKNGVPCKMGGFARAQLTAKAETIVDPLINAYSVYADPTGIPWADRWNNLVNAEGWVTVAEKRGDFDDNSVPDNPWTATDDPNHHGTPWPTSATAAGWQTGQQEGVARALFHLIIAGEEVFDEYGEVALNQTYVKTLYSAQQKTPKLEVDFWVGPVPVTLGAWGVLSYGAFFKAETKVPTTCVYPPELFKLTASINPWAHAEAGAQAGIGIAGIASGGVRGYLTLLHADLPLIADAALVAKAQNAFALDFGLSSYLKLRTLDGRLAIYAQALGVDVFEHELFRWNGFRYTLPLFDVSASLPLGAIGAPVQ